MRTGFAAAACVSAMLWTPTSQAQQNVSQQEARDWREEYAYTLGVQAYIYAFPVVYLSELRYRWVTDPKADFYAALNHLHHKRALADAKSYRSGGSPNYDTLYSWGWLDLTKGPVILSHPDMGDRYFTFEIAGYYSDNFAYIGKRTTGSKAGNFAILPPGWKGQLPADIKQSFEAPTPYVLVFGRTFINGPEDAANVAKLQDQYLITPLSYWGRQDARLPENHEIWKPYDRKTDPLADWKTINRAMTENPPPERDKVLLALFANIGIGQGQDVDLAKLDDATKRGLARADVEGMREVDLASKSGYRSTFVNRWSYPPEVMGRAGNSGDFLTRASIQCHGGIISNDPEEAIYINTFSDVDGKALNGRQRYIMQFNGDNPPPVNEFWSLTLYDAADGNFVDNPKNRYAFSNRTETLKKATNASFEIYLQSGSPGADKESNWLPTPKDKRFYLVLRTYGPKQQLLDHKWTPPAVQRVEAAK